MLLFLFPLLLAPCAGSEEGAPTPTVTASPAPTATAASGEGETAGLDLPSTCRQQEGGRFTYVNYTAGYCLQYPASFHVGDVLPEGAPNVENILGLYGPAYDDSLEPLRAGMSIVVVGPAEGRTLQQVVEEAVVSAGSEAEIARRPARLGGEAAVILDGMPGRTENRKVLAIHEDTVYEVTVYPTGDEFPEVAGDVALVWQAVLSSFTFLSEDVLEQFAPCPEEASPYADVAAGYCLRYPSSLRLFRSADPAAVTIADAPLAAGDGEETARATMTIEMVLVSPERSLQALVDGIVANFPEAEVQQRQVELGGKEAIVIEGLPGRMENRQLFVRHGDALYRLTLSPAGDEFQGATAAAEGLWEAVTESFTFLPAAD
ncbi:MAG: hypothetical protein R3248_14805 [Candidatus Promineifilaceae bacterium]|nr:hypothetical protein [Candidatus Promineifilaceae bacterium]